MSFKYLEFVIPGELEDIRKFWGKIYSHNSKEVYITSIELDENDELQIDMECSCKGFQIPVLQGKPKKMCKHLFDLERKIKLMGYLELKPADLIDALKRSPLAGKEF